MGVRVNVLKAVVVEVKRLPEKICIHDRTYWSLEFKYDCYGRESDATRIFDSEEEALQIQVGYEFEV